MPMYRNPKFAYVEPRGGGGLVAAGVAVVAVGAAAVWVVREVLKIWVELAVIAGGTTVVMGSWLVWMAIKFNRGSLQVNQEAKAEAIAAARAARALPAGDVHYHTHYEEHRHQHQHDDQHVHIHQAPAAEPRPAIAARKVVPGVVLGAAPEAIEKAGRAPLYRINASEYTPIEENRK